MELKLILALYEEATDKKMTVKQLKNELEESNFVVKKGDLGYVLKNWKEKTGEIDNIEEIDTENVEFIEE
jgi:Holliday junction resolvase-like predicted endonuclease